MSVILDALKRSEEERSSLEPPKLSAPAREPTPRQRRRIWPWVVGAVLLANVAALFFVGQSFLTSFERHIVGGGEQRAEAAPDAAISAPSDLASPSPSSVDSASSEEPVKPAPQPLRIASLSSNDATPVIPPPIVAAPDLWPPPPDDIAIAPQRSNPTARPVADQAPERPTARTSPDTAPVEAEVERPVASPELAAAAREPDAQPIAAPGEPSARQSDRSDEVATPAPRDEPTVAVPEAVEPETPRSLEPSPSDLSGEPSEPDDREPIEIPAAASALTSELRDQEEPDERQVSALPSEPEPEPKEDPYASVPLLWYMPQAFQSSVPDLDLTVHIFSQDPRSRMVIINGRNYREGDRVERRVALEAITPNGVVLKHRGKQFRLGRQ